MINQPVSKAGKAVGQAENRASKKVWVLSGIWISSMLFLMFQGGKMAYMVFIIISILAVYIISGRWSGIVKVKGIRSIMSKGKGRKEWTAGDVLHLNIRIQIPGFWPIPYVLIQDQLLRGTDVEHRFEVSLVPDWRRRGDVIYKTQPLRRGTYRFDQITCSTEDIFGLFKHEGTLKDPRSFIVLPKTVAIREWKHFERISRGLYHHAATTQRLRETTQINGVRDYHYGDRISRIHWNATARTGSWKSKEFERETLPRMKIILDREKEAYADPEHFELAVSVAASLLQFGHKNKLPQGLLSLGREAAIFESHQGSTHLRRMMNHLIDTELDGSSQLPDTIKSRPQLLGGASFYVLISPRSKEAMKEAMEGMERIHAAAAHIWIAPEHSAADHRSGVPRFFHNSSNSYAVSSLKELPKVLEGRGRL